MKYRKKPVVIEATQFIKDNSPWPDGVCLCANQYYGPHIHTLEGPLSVTDKDWIITGIKGEKYPCKPDIFEATYEQVADATSLPFSD